MHGYRLGTTRCLPRRGFVLHFEESPASLSLLLGEKNDAFDPKHMKLGLSAPKMLAKELDLTEPIPIIRMQHHYCHSWFSYCISPFANSDKPTLIAVLDGFGDRDAISIFTALNGQLREIFCNASLFDSVRYFYSIISSTQGGWTTPSAWDLRYAPQPVPRFLYRPAQNAL